MPQYDFKCTACEYLIQRIMSIPQFLEWEQKVETCPQCQAGSLSQEIKKIRAMVDKSRDQIVLDVQDEVRKTVQKVRSGDERAIRDIYGEQPNPHKQTESPVTQSSNKSGSFRRVKEG